MNLSPKHFFYFSVWSLAVVVPCTCLADTSKTKEEINKAGEPLQRGASRAVGLLQNFLDAQKRQFEQYTRDHLDGANRVATKIEDGLQTGKIQYPGEKLQSLKNDAATLRVRLDELKGAPQDRYGKVRQETMDALKKIQPEYYKAASLFPEEREKEVSSVTTALQEIQGDIQKLQSKSQGLSPEGQDRVQGAIKSLQDDQSKVSTQLGELRSAPPNRWASTRKAIADVMNGAEDRAWKAFENA